MYDWLIRKPTSWLLYWIGDAISRTMLKFDLYWLYPAYNRIMLASSDVQGETDFGPWREPEGETQNSSGTAKL